MSEAKNGKARALPSTRQRQSLWNHILQYWRCEPYGIREDRRSRLKMVSIKPAAAQCFVRGDRRFMRGKRVLAGDLMVALPMVFGCGVVRFCGLLVMMSGFNVGLLGRGDGSFCLSRLMGEHGACFPKP